MKHGTGIQCPNRYVSNFIMSNPLACAMPVLAKTHRVFNKKPHRYFRTCSIRLDIYNSCTTVCEAKFSMIVTLGSYTTIDVT